jgi:hypothetical protein
MAQNDDNLVMARDIKDTNDIPIVVRKKAALVTVEIIEDILMKTKMDIQVYFVLLERVISMGSGTYNPCGAQQLRRA